MASREGGCYEAGGVSADEDARGDGFGEVVAWGFEGGEGEGGVDGEAGTCAFDEGVWREDEEGVTVMFDEAMEAVPVGGGDLMEGACWEALEIEEHPGRGTVAEEEIGGAESGEGIVTADPEDAVEEGFGP